MLPKGRLIYCPTNSWNISNRYEGMDDQNKTFLRSLSTLEEIKPIKFEIGEFRLQIFLLLCVLTKTILRLKKESVDTMMYPGDADSTPASRQNLKDAFVSYEDTQITMDDLKVELDCVCSPHWGNGQMETALCESRSKRFEKIYDVFIENQNIYLILNGEVYQKKFGDPNANWTKSMFDWETEACS